MDQQECEPPGSAPLSRSSELLWNGLDSSGRGPKPGLTLTQIVEAAIKVADESGIDALSMRGIARELGVGAMSLYRYVPGKSELLDLVLDHLIAPSDEVWTAAQRGDGPRWRRALKATAHQSRHMYLSHPWLLQINWSRPAFGPNTIGSLEAVAAQMDDLPATDRDRVNIVTAIDGFVVGSTREQILYETAAAETGVSNDEYWESQYPVLVRAMETGDYPTLAGFDEDAFSGGYDEVFELGLNAMLDGIAGRFSAA